MAGVGGLQAILADFGMARLAPDQHPCPDGWPLEACVMARILAICDTLRVRKEPRLPVHNKFIRKEMPEWRVLVCGLRCTTGNGKLWSLAVEGGQVAHAHSTMANITTIHLNGYCSSFVSAVVI